HVLHRMFLPMKSSGTFPDLPQLGQVTGIAMLHSSTLGLVAELVIILTGLSRYCSPVAVAKCRSRQHAPVTAAGSPAPSARHTLPPRIHSLVDCPALPLSSAVACLRRFWPDAPPG